MFERAGVDIAWAKVTTLGSSVVDAFCITVPPLVGTDVEGRQRTELERDLYAVLPAPPPGQAGGRRLAAEHAGDSGRQQIGLARV